MSTKEDIRIIQNYFAGAECYYRAGYSTYKCCNRSEHTPHSEHCHWKPAHDAAMRLKKSQQPIASDANYFLCSFEDADLTNDTKSFQEMFNMAARLNGISMKTLLDKLSISTDTACDWTEGKYFPHPAVRNIYRNIICLLVSELD